MRLAFWKRKDDEPRGCQHMWSDWSDPVTMETTVISGYNFATGDATQRQAMVQSRRCLTCNFHERHFV